MIQAQKYNIKINLWGQEEDVEIELLDQAIKPRMKCETALKYRKMINQADLWSWNFWS